MVKPTLVQRVLRRPSQRYAGSTNAASSAATATERSRERDHHSTKEELLRVAAELHREDSRESPQPSNDRRGSSGDFFQSDHPVTASASVLFPSSTATPSARIDIRGDTQRAERRNPSLRTTDGTPDETSDTFFTPATSPIDSTSPASSSPSLSKSQTPLHSPVQTPSITPSTSAASSTASLGSFPSTDFARSSTSQSAQTTPTVTMIPVTDSRRKSIPHSRTVTYTDEDWAKDVRWLVAPDPQGTSSKQKDKVVKRRSAPPTLGALAPRYASSSPVPACSPSPASLPANPPAAHGQITQHPPPRAAKSKAHVKAKTASARTIVGMTVLLEVEEDLEPDSSEAVPGSEAIMGHKRSHSYTYSSNERFECSSTPNTPKAYPSSAPRLPRLAGQRSSSSPSLLQPGSTTPKRPSSLRSQVYTTSSSSSPELLDSSAPPRRALSTTSHAVSSTTKSPYTSAPANALDALAAHVSMSETPDALPSNGMQGFTSLVLPRATSPLADSAQSSRRPWRLSMGQRSSTTVGESIGVGLGLGDKVDLTRAGLAQTSMASIEVVRGIASRSRSGRKASKSRGAMFGMNWFSKDREKSAAKEKGKEPLEDSDGPLGFTVYRKPPVYVGAGSVLVQIWGVGLDGIDACLVGTHRSRSADSLQSNAPYGVKGSKHGDKDKGRRRTAPVGHIPGRSFVGRVLEVGWEVGVDTVRRGDWVVGLMSVHKCGALAEFVLVDRHRIHRIPHPFMPERSPLPFGSSFSDDSIDRVADDGLERRPQSNNTLSVNELALLPLCGVPAYRAVRTFNHITLAMGQSPIHDGHDVDPHVQSPLANIGIGFPASEGPDSGFTSKDLPGDVRPRALVLRGHDGPGALAARMLVHQGWSVWAHVPVPFMLPGPTPEAADDLKDEDEEKELEKRRSVLRRIEERLRAWGVDEVLFVQVESLPLSALFGASIPALEVPSTWSPYSIHLPRSSASSSPSLSPFSRSQTSSPISSPYSHVFSSGHLSSASYPSSSADHQAFTTPYSFTPLPLAPYHCEQDSIVALLSYLSRSRVRLDAIFDTVGGREIWEVGRSLLGRPVRDPSRQDVDAQFTTVVGDAPDRVVSTAGDNFRAGVRALRIGGAKDQHAFEDSGFQETLHHGRTKDKKMKLKPRPVNYSWVNIVSDVDWEGNDVHDTLKAILRVAMNDNIKLTITPLDFPLRKAKGKRKAVFDGGEGIEDELQGRVVPFENTPDVFIPGGGLEHGGTIVSRIAG